MMFRSLRHGVGGPAPPLIALMLAAMLPGCSGPIEAYRSVSGLNRNDPDPATAPFAENLAAAEHESYPNLGTVPDVPVMTTTAEERAKVAKGLDALRSSAQAPDAQGHPGSAAPGPVPPPPEIPPSLANTLAAAPPAPPPPPMRGANEPPVPGPLTSSLQSPAVAALPGVEATRRAPQQAALAPIPPPAPSQLPPAAVQSGNPQPTPAAPVLPAPQHSPQAAALPPPKLPPTPTIVAAFEMPAGATALAAADQAQLAEVVAQYKQKPGIVRIVAYTVPADGGAEQLNNFRSALDRAQAVAKALVSAGVPTKQVQTEAAPASPAASPSRVEVQLLPAAPPTAGAKG